MENLHSDFEQVARHIRGVLSHSLINNAESDYDKSQVRILKEIFKDAQDITIVASLDNWQAEGPTSFEEQWGNVKSALENYGNDPLHAIFLFARLLGWVYIESAWEAQRSKRPSPGNRYLGVLAAIQLGLYPDSILKITDSILKVTDSIQKSIDSIQKEILTVIYTHNVLIGNLLFQRFEKTIKGGLDAINSAKDSVEQRIGEWEKRLGEIETRVGSADEKLTHYAQSLEKYQPGFGFTALVGAYSNFFERKRWERNIWGFLMVVVIALISGAVYFEYKLYQNDYFTRYEISLLGAMTKTEQARVDTAKLGLNINKPNPLMSPFLAGDTDHTIPWARFFLVIPFIVVVLLLLYLFRVVLMHFNSAKAQLLQLEMKMAACGFIQAYAQFLKDNDRPADFNKFESLIFGGIVADLEKVPSSFDGLDQIVKAIKAFKD